MDHLALRRRTGISDRENLEVKQLSGELDGRSRKCIELGRERWRQPLDLVLELRHVVQLADVVDKEPRGRSLYVFERPDRLSGTEERAVDSEALLYEALGRRVERLVSPLSVRHRFRRAPHALRYPPRQVVPEQRFGPMSCRIGP